MKLSARVVSSAHELTLLGLELTLDGVVLGEVTEAFIEYSEE